MCQLYEWDSVLKEEIYWQGQGKCAGTRYKKRQNAVKVRWYRLALMLVLGICLSIWLFKGPLTKKQPKGLQNLATVSQEFESNYKSGQANEISLNEWPSRSTWVPWSYSLMSTGRSRFRSLRRPMIEWRLRKQSKQSIIR